MQVSHLSLMHPFVARPAYTASTANGFNHSVTGTPFALRRSGRGLSHGERQMSNTTTATSRRRLRKAAVFALVRGAATAAGTVLIEAATRLLEHH